MLKKLKPTIKIKPELILKNINGLFEIFFPKATGIALRGDNLYMTKVCHRAFNITHETKIINEFLYNDSSSLDPDFAPFKRSLNEIVFSLPREKVIIREVDLPGIEMKEIKDALEYQLDSFIPFSPEDVYYDVYKIDSKETNKKILIIAVKKEILDTVLERLATMGIFPTKVIISPLAFIPFVADKKGEVVTIHKFTKNYCYNRFLNGSFISTVLLNNRPSVFNEINSNIPNEIMEEIGTETSIKTFYENRKVTIENSNDPDDHKSEEDTVETQVQFSSLSDKHESYGAALYGIRNDGQKFNLLKEKPRVIHLQKALIAGFSLMLLLFLFLMPHVLKKRKLEALSLINHEIRVLKDDIRRIEEVRNRVVIMEETLTNVGKAQAVYAARIKVIHELSEKIPKTAWVKELYVYRNIFEIGGTALAATDLIPILQNSEFFYDVGLTAPVVKTPEGDESFRIRGQINIAKVNES